MLVGLITYHAAYNFGSVLQAYATQTIIEQITGNCEIINYRTKEQRRIYSIFVWEKGKYFFKSLIKNIMILPDYSNRKRRAKRYEKLFVTLYNLGSECKTPEEVYEQWEKYDLIVSGSDQIWNKHSNELHRIDWKYMSPYLLCGYTGKKISYASSTASMSLSEIERIAPEINTFSAVSGRESETTKILNKLCTVHVSKVLDPTLLLRQEEWIELMALSHKQEHPYILYYALNKRKDIKTAKVIVLNYARKHNLKVKFIAPLGFGIKEETDFEVLGDVDPVDFLNLILNAETIITDSYHGTVFSVNFKKDFFSINGINKSDFRKTDFLKLVGLESRSISKLTDLMERTFDKINYAQVYNSLDIMRKESIEYLRKALQE